MIAELVIADRERRGAGFGDVRRWPDRMAGFEDLVFLFSSTVLAHGIASLRLDEAAYLFRLVREAQPATVVEIGRFRGGSTFLIAAALGPDGVVHSYDLDARQGRRGDELDRELADALARYGLSDRVRLHVEDSRTAAPPAEKVELVFVDGDHSEEGVRADVGRWGALLRPGGHLILHDAADAPDFVASFVAGPARVAAGLGDGYERRAGAGSLVHLVRRA
jgi:predicted O-methyltransferase YrrM